MCNIRPGGAAQAVVLLSVVAIGICSITTEETLSEFLRDVAEPPCPPSTLVLLWLSDKAPYRSPALQRTLTSPVEQWTSFGERQINELKAHVERNKNIWVIALSATTREKNLIIQKLNTMKYTLSMVRFVFQLEPGEQLFFAEYPEVACILVGVNSTAIDVALDGYRQCTRRRSFPSVRDFCKSQVNSSYRVFNGREMTVVTDVTLTTVNVTHRYNRAPESSLLMSMLKGMNASIVPYHFVGTGMGKDRTFSVVHRKAADLSLLPTGLSEEVDAIVDIRAINNFRSLVFFSRTAEKVPPSIMHTILSSGPALAVLTCCGLVVLSVHSCQKVLGAHTSVTACLLFLVSNLLARGYPDPAPSRSHVTRILILFWAVGVLSFSTYLQCVVTSEVNAPTRERKIKNADDLLKYAKLGQVLPCLELSSDSEKFINASTRGIGKILRDLLVKCSSRCLNRRSDTSECLALAERGTHVYVRTYDFVSEIRWSRRGYRLAASEDSLRFMPTAPAMPKGSVFGPALKRLVVELLEHGHFPRHYSMGIGMLMIKLPPPPAESEEVALISFWDHFLFYAWGTLLACVALVFEMLYA